MLSKLNWALTQCYMSPIFQLKKLNWAKETYLIFLCFLLDFMCHFFFKCLENLSVKPRGSEFLNEKVFNFRFIFFLDIGLCRFSICVMVYASFVKVCTLRNLTLKFQIYLLKIFIISFLLLLFFLSSLDP